MKQLQEKLEEFFLAFEGKEIIDLSEYRRSLLESVHHFSAEYDTLSEKVADYTALQEENTALRQLIAAECRAKLIVLGDAEAEEQAEELLKLSLPELKKRRESIVRRFDEQFSQRHTVGAARSVSTQPGMPEIQAFRS